MERTTTISPADVERQLDFCQKVADVAARWPERPLKDYLDGLGLTYQYEYTEGESI